MANALNQQAERLYKVFSELVRSHQFRDREGICCHGVSVSQCYTLELLFEHGALNMSDLAGRLYLEVSTMTRVVDHLVKHSLATRAQDLEDRRVWRVRISNAGRELISTIRQELIREHESVLLEIPSENREAVVKAMSNLLVAFARRQNGPRGETICASSSDPTHPPTP